MKIVASILGLAMAVPPLAQAQLVGHWRFDEGAGTTYADSSPNNNDAYLDEFSGWRSDVPPGAANNPASIFFNGTNTYIDTGYQGIAGASPRTVAFWVKATGTSNHGIVAWGNSTINGAKWHLRINNSAANGPAGAFRVETQGDYTIGSTQVNDGQWHHLAAVYPGGGELGTTELYVDGVLESNITNNPSTQAVDTSITVNPVTIGRRTQANTLGYYPGSLDDVRIYDRALSPDEVVGLMGMAPTADGLVMHLPLDEGSGLFTDDVGSGDNDGTIFPQATSAPLWSQDTPPHLSNSLEFDGGTVLLTDYPGVQGSASRSVTFWFKTSTITDNGILAWGDSGASGRKWHARLNTAAADGPVGALRVEIQDGRAVATTPVNDGQWHHAAIVFEEDADPDITDVVFFLDGEPDPTAQFTSVPIDTDSSADARLNVTLGGRFQGAALRGHTGNLADLRIYASGLTQAEVQAIMSDSGEAEFRIIAIDYDPAGGEARLEWTSRPGEEFSVESSTDLQNQPWFEIIDSLPASSDSDTTTYTVTGIPGGTGRLFFRVRR